MKLFSYLWKILKSYFVKSKSTEEENPMISKEGERESSDLVIVFDDTNRISKSVEEDEDEESILHYM